MGMKTALLYLVVLTVVMAGALAYGFILGELPSAWVEMWSRESTQFLLFIKVGEMPKPFSWV